MKKLLLLFLLSFVFLTTYVSADTWTWMLYMLEDNTGLDGMDDLNEWEANGSTQNVNYVVLIDANDDSKDGVYHIEHDPNGYDDTFRSPRVSTQFGTDPNMGDWHTLRDFMNYCAQNYPADHYGLTLWDHGDEIFKGDVTGSIFGSVVNDPTKDFVGGMKLWELDDAVADFTNNIGHKLDILGFDVCLLGHIETAYQLKDYVDYVIASEKTEPGDGWDYVGAFSDMTNNNGNITASQQATNIVNAYVTFYGGKNGQSEGVTQAATSTALLESDLIPALNTFADKLRRDVYTHESSIKTARDNASYWDSDNYGAFYIQHKDLGSFAQNIIDDTSLPSDLRDAAQDVMDALATAVIAEGHTVTDPAYGLKIWMPEDIDNDDNETYYMDPSQYLTFSNTLWDEFLYNYNDPQPYDNDKPPVQNLTATVGDGFVTLNWDAPASKNTLDHYKINRDGSLLADNIPVGTTSYTDNAVTNGTTYNYDVYAVYTGSPSGDSPPNSISATPNAPLAPPYSQDFSSGSLPTGWENVDNQGNGQVWQFDNPGGRTFNSTTHSNGFAILDSDNYGSGNSQNADLISPIFDFSSYSSVTLQFEHYFREYSNSSATLSYTTDGQNWTTIQTWTSSTENAATFSQTFTTGIAGQPNVRFKWNYIGSYGYYWCVDDISITGVANGTPEFSLNPSTLDFGNVEVGQSSTLQFTISNTGDGGTLTGNITTPSGYTVALASTKKHEKGKNTLSYSISTSQTFDLTFSPTTAQNYDGTVTITCDQDTPSDLAVSGNGIQADLSVTPTSLSQTMISNETATENLKLDNNGAADMNYTASVQYGKGRASITVYPKNENYWTGTTDGSSKTETSLVKGYDNQDGWMKFDISSIPDNATINSVEFHGYVNDTYYPYWSITPISNDPVTADASTLENDITAEEDSGYYNHNNEDSSYSTGWKTITLGGNAASDLQNALLQDWFAIGIASRDNSTTYYIDFDGWNQTNKPYLVIDYTVSASWLKINGSSSYNGTISAGSYENLTIGFDSTNLTEGTYNANIVISSNDPDSPTNVPVTLTVQANSSNTAEGGNNNQDGTGSADVDVPPVTANGDVVDPDVSVDPDGTVPIIVDVTVTDSPQHSGMETAQTYLSYSVSVSGNIDGVQLAFDLAYDGLSQTPQSVVWWNSSTSQWETVASPQWNTPSANHVSFNLTIPNTKDGSTEFVLSGDENPLPVVFSSFYSMFTNGKAILQWVTASESNSNYWNVYRGLSNNYGQAIKINSTPIPAQNNTTQETKYTYVDNGNFQNHTTYYYWLENISLSGESSAFGPFELNVEYSDNPDAPTVVQYGLHQNYPNPFNPETKITFALKQNSKVSLVVYNVKGQKVKTLLNNEQVDKDKLISVVWDGTDDSQRKVASGIYYYKLNYNGKQLSKKMLMLK